MALEFIKSCKNIVLVVHKNPDADSIGSASAFYSYLLRENKNITFFCVSDNISQNLSFIPWKDKIKSKLPRDIDCIISFDCGNIDRLGCDVLGYDVVNIDHHESNDYFGKYNIINSDAISTTEVVYDFFIENDIKINAKMAVALYAGLLDDSDCFKSHMLSTKTLSMAHSLLLLGANHSEAISHLFMSRSLAFLRLKSKMFAEMELLCDARVAVFDIDKTTLESYGATIDDAKDILQESLSMKRIECGVLFFRGAKKIIVSFRTKGAVDANKLASMFGGGGHRTRAGAKITENEKIVVINEIRSYLESQK